MDEERLRELRLALYTLRGNAFWLWLRRTMVQRLDYLEQRLRQAANWEEHCFTGGQLDAVEQLLKQIAEIENSGKDGERDEFHTVNGGL